MTSDLERVRKIVQELEEIAQRHNLEMVYHRHVDGKIIISVGCSLQLRQEEPAPAAPAENPGGTP